MLQTRRAIFILVAYWLAIFAGPVASAAMYCAPSSTVAVAAATVAVAADCPMGQHPLPAGKTDEAPCCCGPAAGAGSRQDAAVHLAAAHHDHSVAAVDPCCCSFQSGVPVELPDATVVSPVLSAVALLPRPAAVFIAPPAEAAPQAPIRGPSAAPLLLSPLAPDAGRAPPTA